MEKLKYSGHISIESDSGNIKELDHNTITHLFEELVATVGIDTIISKASPIGAGKTYVQGAMGRSYQQRYWTDQQGKQLVTLYLLNLSSAEKAALSSDSYILPVYSSDFMSIDSSKVIGWATARLSATAASKEGHIIPHSGALLVDNRQHGLSWRFEPNTVSGSFNTVAIGINCIEDNNYAGVNLRRSLDLKDIFGGDSSYAFDYFMIPNVKSEDGTVVWTGENEILLGGRTSSDYTVARYVLNLATGELTSLDSSDNRYGLELFNAATTMQYVFGDYLITCESQPTYRQSNTVYATNIKTKSKNWFHSQSYCVRGFFKYNGYLYACSQYTADDEFNALAFDSTLTAVGSADIHMTLPNSWTYLQSGIFPYGNNMVLVHNTETSSGVVAPSSAHCLIFSDPSDIEGSVVGVLPGIQPTCFTFYNGEPIFFDSGYHDQAYFYEEAMTYTYMNGSSSQSVNQGGLKFTTLGMFGNLLSFKVYNEDMTISEGDGVKVTYWYTFDQ